MSVYVCGYRNSRLVTKLLPGTWQGGKKCDLKVASVLAGGVIMFVSLLLPTRRKKKYIKGARQKKRT